MEPSTGLPILGRADDRFRLEVLFAPGATSEGADDPFVSLGDAGLFSRVLLGRIVMGADSTVRHLAVKVQRSSYRSLEDPLARSAFTNARIDETWERERDHLLQTASPEIVSLLDPGMESFRLRPLTVCRKTRKSFHPFCPVCRGPLIDCRDDDLLREVGLSPYSTSSQRYLSCGPCAAARRSLVFYTSSPSPEDAPRNGATVRTAADLVHDLGDLLREGASQKGPPLEPLFPCAGCEHRSECYPDSGAGDGATLAEARLTPLSFQEFHVLPLEALHLHLDELMDLLGGAGWEQVRRRALEDPGAAGRAALLAPLDPAFSSSFQWIHREDGSGRYPLEVLRLKLLAFTQLCRGLRAYHAACRRPHLDLDPASAMALLAPPGRDLPARWSFAVKLIDLAGPPPFRPPGPGEVPGELYQPVPAISKTFAAPEVRDGLVGPEEPMRVTITAVQTGKGGTLDIEGHSPRARLLEYAARDVVRITPSNPLLFGEKVIFWGELTEVEEHGFRTTVRLARPPRKLEELKTPFPFEGSVTFYKRFGIPCDLYSLGMLLFRGLLANDGRDIFAVDDAIVRVLRKTSAALEEARGKPGSRRMEDVLLREMRREEGVFEAPAVLYAQSEREASPPAIPGRLWSDLLLLGLRLVTRLPGFSFSTDRVEPAGKPPEALLDQVLLELDALNLRIHVELFGREGRDRQIAGILREVLADATEGILEAETPQS